jgi:hypothetical protein
MLAMNKFKFFVLLLGVLVSMQMHAQRVIRGSVTDSTGETLVGVSVLLKSASRGIATDENGKFAISVPDGPATLIFSCPGYETRDTVVQDDSYMLLVALQCYHLKPNEIVTTAMGRERIQRVPGYSESTITCEQVKAAGKKNLIKADKRRNEKTKKPGRH